MKDTLSPELRRQLERAVAGAREVAETGARVALGALAVHHPEAYEHMGAEERNLRRRLRAHGRQLGDLCNPSSGMQAFDHLVHECAYEHWHGMLFAQFLAENHLLIQPEWNVAVTLEECEELGKEAGFDKWTMAAHFAHEMLPQVFRPDRPVFEVRLAREHRLELEGLVERLPAEVFLARDSLGWVYQFWQSRKKDEVNRSGSKIGADELPAVTQLFTEPYMVSFLLDNSLGAWWAARRLSESDLNDASSEAELRQKAAIPGVPFDYLRFVRCEDTAGGEGGRLESTGVAFNSDGHVSTADEVARPASPCTADVARAQGTRRSEAEPASWRLAAGAFDGWPKHLGELRVIDPCCGSGHFLVAAFTMLVPMRMDREGLVARQAVDAVLRENLHGLELDPRCVELAAFALALAAWTYPDAGGYRPLPALNLACSGLSVGTTKDRWTEIAAGHRNLRIALDWLYDEFRDAPVLGSLLNPAGTKAAKLTDWPALAAALAEALARVESDERHETAVAAQGLAKAAELLSGRYHLVATNVPYLARGKQGETLRRFCGERYPSAKNDLATVFLERCLELCSERGTTSVVLPQNWLFLASYKKLREKLLKTETWHLLARVGEGGFESSAAAGAFVALLTLSRGNPASRPGGLFADVAAAGTMHGLDVSEFRTADEKAARMREVAIQSAEQTRQLKNPDSRIVLGQSFHGELLEESALAPNGMHGGDSWRFRNLFWETPAKNTIWRYFQTAVNETEFYGGREHVFYWPDGGRIHQENPNAYVKGRAVWGQRGVVVRVMRELPVTLYDGDLFDISCVPIVPRKPEYLLPIWCFCSSPEYNEAVRRIDQKLNVTNATLAKVPFDLDHWTKVAEERYPNGLPRPYSDDPNQWLFHGHPCGSVIWDETAKWTAHGPLRTDPSVLHVTVARLLGFRWPAEQDAEMELADEQREWVRRSETLVGWADEDGLVCIPSVRGEPPAGERLLELLAVAFGDAWNEGILTKLLAEAGSQSLDDWLRNHFFEQHFRLFHHRPFVWHIWDGRRHDGFHALVSYHKLVESDGKGRRLLESLTYSYLGDWIARQRDGVQRDEVGAADRLAAAEALQKRLAAIIEGEPPFDVFVRWKPVHDQPIGWEPDINDGVRLNIRPFMAEDIPGGKKGAGILRSKPNVHWRKDRGKEPLTCGKRSKPPWIEDEDWDPEDKSELRPQQDYPWFWRGDEFTGERRNDIHLSIAEKSVCRLAAERTRR